LALKLLFLKGENGMKKIKKSMMLLAMFALPVVLFDCDLLDLFLSGLF
jgi:hypothetical protein